MLAYAWPGNVRELRNVMERAVVLTTDGTISPDLLPQTAAVIPWVPQAVAEARPETDFPAPEAALAISASSFRTANAIRPFAEAKAQFLESFERAYCDALLVHAGGNVALAARLAVMDKKNLHKKIRDYKLDAHRWPKA